MVNAIIDLGVENFRYLFGFVRKVISLVAHDNLIVDEIKKAILRPIKFIEFTFNAKSELTKYNSCSLLICSSLSKTNIDGPMI
jgi:hypothetical protein